MNARLAAVAAVLALAGCASIPAAPPPAARPSATPVITQPVPLGVAAPSALRQVHDPGRVTGTITGPCRTRDGGQLPDARCTPGAYDPQVTAAVLCASGYTTRSYRPPASATDRFKYRVAWPAYGISSTVRGELDHDVPLELGGANDASNLWPEAGKIPNPKDRVETDLHDAVCSGRVTLRAAQTAIAADWLTAEHVLGLR